MAALKKLKMFKENVKGSPASVTLTCDFTVTGLHRGHFCRNVPTFFRESCFKKVLTTCKGCLFVNLILNVFIGLPKQKHAPKIVLESFSENIHKFHRKEPLM